MLPGDAACGKRRVHREHAGKPDDRGDRDEIVLRTVGQVLVDPRIDRHRGVGGDADGVPVGACLLERLQPDRAIGAAAVFGNDRLLQSI